MSVDRWPLPDDPVTRELGRALEEARLRGPDDVTLRRGWTAVAEPPEPPRTPRWRWFVGGVTCATAFALAFALWLWPRAGGPLPQQNGIAARTTAGPAASGMRRLTLEGGVEAVLGATSVMRIEQGAPHIEEGEVRFSVPHRQPGHPFVVHAREVRVVVVGTRFGVNVADSDVAVDVDEGIVEVWRGRRLAARLLPGQRWSSTDLSDGEAAAGPTTVERNATPRGIASAHGTAVSARGHRRDAHHRELAMLATDDRSPVDARGAGGGSSANDSTSAARAALAAGDTARALQIYRAAAQKTGPSAENAAYEIGKILNERMGQPANAVAVWRRYRAEHPDGILRVETDVSIIETLAHVGESDDALGEANDFLRRHPDSERRGEIARLAGDLYRARGDCRGAAHAYQLALGAPRSREVAETSSFRRAACLVRLGDAGGVDAVRAYLHAYPAGRYRGEAAALLGDGHGQTDERPLR